MLNSLSRLPPQSNNDRAKDKMKQTAGKDRRKVCQTLPVELMQVTRKVEPPN